MKLWNRHERTPRTQRKALFFGSTAGICLAYVGLASSGFAASNSEHDKVHKGGAIAADIFAGTNVLRIQIEVSQSGMNKLRQTGWGNGRERPVVMATVKEGGLVYTNVALHLKGAA